jgi:hypothetical protein
VLDIEKLDIPQSSFESSSARIAMLSVLAYICDQEGDQGNHVDPYIQARQLLQIVFSEAAAAKLRLPLSYNSEGVANWGLLKCYPQYNEKFKTQPIKLGKFQAAIKERRPLSRLGLVQRAIAAYKRADVQSNTNLAKARFLNNQVDLLLTFLSRIYFEDALDPNDIRDVSDRQFVIEQFSPPTMVPGWTPRILVEILNRWKQQLSEALALSKEPEIYFTVAQLHAVGGRLNDQYHLRDDFWSRDDLVAETALVNLQTAAAMQLPIRIFQESSSERFYLDWLWRRPGMRRQLEKLQSSK